MKKRIAACGALAVLAAVAAALLLVYRPAAPASVFETAALLLADRDEQIYVTGDAAHDQEGVFRALEAVVPAPFALRCVRYDQLPVPLTRFTLERRGQAAQQQAVQLAEMLAREATAGIHEPAEQLRVLHDLVVMGCAYDAQTAAGLSGLDGFSAPFTAYGALVEERAVCAGYARAYMLLCQAVGLDVIYVTSAEMNHGWNAVRLDGVTYFVDCTFDDPVPDMGQYALHEYCLVPAETLRRTHVWDEVFYEALLDQMESKAT